MSRKNVMANNILIGALTLIFLLAGLGLKVTRLVLQRPLPAPFLLMGYPEWFLFAIGILEAAGALMLWFRRTRLIGAGLLLAIMVGAVISTGRVGFFLFYPIDITLAIAAGAVIWLNRDHWPLNRILRKSNYQEV